MMSLAEYDRKRDFRKTPEPRGKRRKQPPGRLFVVQKHAARRLHYDLRLEHAGVLKSWAVPKGPSLDPQEMRLAVQVEDHPFEYAEFEGIIPEGEYGGGTVMVWDRGAWDPEEDPEAGLRKGRLKFSLQGTKLRGRWMLVRRGGARAAPGETTWFLIKERDEEARPAAEYELAAEQPLSVKSGRDLDEIRADPRRMWTTDGEQAAPKGRGKRSNTRAASAPKTAKAAGRKPVRSAERQAALPRFVEPQLATLVDAAPAGDEWLHEIKLDGYRMLCRIQGSQVKFVSRNDQDWTEKLRALVGPAGRLGAQTALLDGEVVIHEPDGTTSFQALQNAFREGRGSELVYYVFDLLHLNGRDLRREPLEDRKQQLAELVPPGATGQIRFSEHVRGQGPAYFREACQLGLEGIISKRADRPYQSGRGEDWLKAKCVEREEFVIGGYTPPAGSRKHFGSLLVGYYGDEHRLIYAGRVGTGFNDRMLSDLHAELSRREQAESPFENLTSRTGPARRAHWVRPELVAQVEFSNWTRDHLLRHPSFLGLREDKPATEVVRQTASGKNENRPSRTENMNGRRRRAKPAADSTPGVGMQQPKKQVHARKSRVRGEIEAHGARLTSPDKVLYPEQGLTKKQLADYYAAVADWMLPHVGNRPVSIVRCPQGHRRTCFFQKHPGSSTPPDLRRIPIQEQDEVEDYMVVDNLAGLIGLVQIGALELHVWGALADDVERPDRIVFDLDPDPTVAWPQVVEAARRLHDLLERLGLVSFLKTTGGKGLHVVVPITRRHSWDEIKDFSFAIAKAMTAAQPDRYVATMSKAARRGKIFIDYLRNARGSTAVAAFSTRARPGAAVSVPVEWRELSDKLRPDQWNVRTLPNRLRKLRSDPWEQLAKVRQSITAKMRQAVGMH